MALLKQCFCYSLRQGSFIIGSYSLVVYCVAFAVELWWIVESLLILPAPAYTLCALYFFDFIMAAILLFGLLVRQRKYLMSWTLMTVLSFFPEAGMVLFMSLYYWPTHKFEYGVIELVYWSLRAIFNIFGAVCVCSLYLTWRDEELILGRLHDLTLANVETGSTGVGVLRSGNFTGTLKGNSNLAYQNYAYVDSSPVLPDNLSYKNSNAFHSSKSNSPTSLHSFFIHQQRNKYYYYHHHRYCAQCQLSPFSDYCFNAEEKTITSLPILCTEASSRIACCVALAQGRPVKSRGRLCASGFGFSGDGACYVASGGGHCQNLVPCSPRPGSCFQRFCVEPNDFNSFVISYSSYQGLVNDTQATTTIVDNAVQKRLGSSRVDHCRHNDDDALTPRRLGESKERQSSGSSSSQTSAVVPKIEIVICTEIHGSIETKVIRPHDTYQTATNSIFHLARYRRAMSESPRIVEAEDELILASSQTDSQQVVGAMNRSSSLTSIMDGDGGNNAKWGESRSAVGQSGGRGGDPTRRKPGRAGGGGAFKMLSYVTHLARCCFSKSNSGSCQSINGSLDEVVIEPQRLSRANRSVSGHRGLFNTRSFTMNSDVQATLGNRASLAMKSEFNPALLFDPSYRKSRISELGIAGIGLEPPGQIPIGTFNRMNRSRSLWNVSNEDYWNRPPPSRPVSMGYVNHIHQLDQLHPHKECCHSVNNNSNATMNLNKQMILKGFGAYSQGYRNPIHGSITSVATSTHPAGNGLETTCGGILRDPDHRRNWLATGRRAQSVDGLNHFFHRYYGRNISQHHNLHPGGILSGDHHSQDWSKSSLCHEEPTDDLRNYQDIAL